MPERALPEPYRWYYFIPLSGHDGRRWYDEYRDPSNFRIGFELDSALGLLRARKIDLAEDALAGAKERIDALAARRSPSVISVLERWYYSSLAYYRYFVGDGEGAKKSLDQARQSMAAAIELAPFLVLLATACCSFSLHYARIERRRCRWKEMSRYIELGRAMVGGQYPLCCLGNDRDIFISDVDAFFRTITPTDDREREALELLLNADARRNGFERAIRSVESIPNVVTPFA